MTNGVKKIGALALLLMTVGCATLQKHGIIDADDIKVTCEDIRLTCALTSGMDLRAKIVCDQAIPACDAVSPASPSGAFVE